MSDSIIDQATTVVYNHLNGETRFALSDADCIVKALSDAGLLRPEFDRWIEANDREVAARALEDAAGMADRDWPDIPGVGTVDEWLGDLADRIRRGGIDE